MLFYRNFYFIKTTAVLVVLCAAFSFLTQINSQCTEKSRVCWVRHAMDYYTCPVNFHIVQRGFVGGDICRMCPQNSIADGNGWECLACKHGEWRAVMHCDNFFSRAYYSGDCGVGKNLKNIRGRLYECVGHNKGVRRRMKTTVGSTT